MAHYRLTESVWTRRDLMGLGSPLALESAGCALKLSDLYEGVTFPV